MVQYESLDVSQQAIVQNGNKGGDEKRTKEKEKIVHSYIGIMTQQHALHWKRKMDLAKVIPQRQRPDGQDH